MMRGACIFFISFQEVSTNFYSLKLTARDIEIRGNISVGSYFSYLSFSEVMDLMTVAKRRRVIAAMDRNIVLF